MPESNIPSPKRYFALHFLLLRFLGLGWWHHPDENDTCNFPGFYLYYSVVTQIVCVAGFIGLETIDPFIGEKDIERFMFNISFVITHDLTLLKIFIFFYMNKEIQDIVRTLEIGLKEFYQNSDKNRRTVKVTKILTCSFLFFGWMTILNTDSYGIIQDIRWKAEVTLLNSSEHTPVRILPQPIYIPWKYQTTTSYVSTFLLETFGLLWTGHIVVTLDTFIASVILHMSSQFSILHEALTTAYDRTLDELIKRINSQLPLSQSNDEYEALVKIYYTKEEIETALETTLNSCIRQHQVLTSCVEKFAKTYTFGFMTQLLSSMAAICSVMVQLSKDSSSLISIKLATSLAFFAAMIIQLAIQCFTSNELTYQAGRISEAVMASKWERMPPRLRRPLVLTMMRAQRPLRLTAAGFANMDNACFLSIMKAAYSYYAVLSQTQI